MQALSRMYQKAIAKLIYVQDVKLTKMFLTYPFYVSCAFYALLLPSVFFFINRPFASNLVSIYFIFPTFMPPYFLVAYMITNQVNLEKIRRNILLETELDEATTHQHLVWTQSNSQVLKIIGFTLIVGCLIEIVRNYLDVGKSLYIITLLLCVFVSIIALLLKRNQIKRALQDKTGIISTQGILYLGDFYFWEEGREYYINSLERMNQNGQETNVLILNLANRTGPMVIHSFLFPVHQEKNQNIDSIVSTLQDLKLEQED